ncbi:MAG: hypothetical protein J5966_04610 [Lachnospiraceae bacterium]|nr:hypothetical protein [Lachnospiraceae bacterium]
MKRTKTKSFSLELELKLNTKEHRFLDARGRSAVSIYNDCLGQCVKRVHKLQHDPEYKDLISQLKVLKDEDAAASNIKSRLNEIRSYYGFTEYDIHKHVISAKHHFNNLGIDECQTLATRAFSTAEKLLYGQASRVRFVSMNDDITIEGKSGKSTLKYKGDWKIQFGRGHVFSLIKPRNAKKLAYAEEALTHRVKYSRLCRRTIRGRVRYFAQFVLEGTPPGKNRAYGDHVPVGIDEGVSTVAVSSGGHVKLHELAPGCMGDAKKVRRLQRAMDRSRRATNPDNYNDDGTIRKGRKTWVKSVRYLKLKKQYQDANRKLAFKRRMSHEQLANRILSVGTDIRIETMSMNGLQKRSKVTKKNAHGKNLSKKRFGKVLLSRAPAAFTAILERKLGYIGLSIDKKDTYSLKASQYDHSTDTYTKKQLKDRIITIDGRTAQRDMYSAFLLEHAPDDTIDRDSCVKDFEVFSSACIKEIEHIRSSGNKHLLWYVT